MHTTFDYCMCELFATDCLCQKQASGFALPPSLVLCCCWAASEPMQPTPPLLSAEEGVRVSLIACVSAGSAPLRADQRDSRYQARGSANREVVEFLAERRDG